MFVDFTKYKDKWYLKMMVLTERIYFVIQNSIKKYNIITVSDYISSFSA